MAAQVIGGGPNGVQPADLERAVGALTEAKLVAFPTETVYGLGADASRAEAVAGIFAAKGRPTGHPLIVHMADSSGLDRFGVEPSAMAVKLANSFWPGPLTVVVNRSSAVAPETVGGMSTVGLRVPDHPVALALLRAFGGPIAAPSANRFGSVSPTTAQHVLDDLGDRIDLVIDGGPAAIGVESTIVDLSGSEPLLLRPGGISDVELEAVLGQPVGTPVQRGLPDDAPDNVRAPGMLASHYAPSVPVELIEANRVADALAGGAAAGRRLGVVGPCPVAHECSWPLPTDASGYAAGLYSSLRAADRASLDRLLVIPPTTGSLLEAVLDRLTKAAGPTD